MTWILLAAAVLALLVSARMLAPARPLPAQRLRPRLPQQVLHPRRLPGVRADSLWRLRPDPHCVNGLQRLGEHALAREADDLGQLGCDIGSCRCTWRPTPDRRRSERRSSGDADAAPSERRRSERRRR